jgi:ubiquinone/menaquinone biosynthesis C-methylase UbiE
MRDYGTTRDPHDGFRDPQQVPTNDLARFLEEADRLPGIRAIQRAMRSRLDPRPGMQVLDAGCGVGLETTRIAAEHPGAHVIGLDRNAEMLRIAQRRAPLSNLEWVEGDIAAIELPPASFDAIRTERVLMYLPGDEFDRGVEELIRLLQPGGRLALFELDYGATILAPGTADDEVVWRAGKELFASLPQPLAGRRLPKLLRSRGLRDVTAEPFSFAVSEPVWRRIVGDTLTADTTPDASVSAWVRDQETAAARGEFVAAFTGVLTSAIRP